MDINFLSFPWKIIITVTMEINTSLIFPQSLRRPTPPLQPPLQMSKKESISAPCTPLTSNNLDYYALRNHHHNEDENHDDSEEEVLHKVGKMRSVSGGGAGGGGGLGGGSGVSFIILFPWLLDFVKISMVTKFF